MRELPRVRMPDRTRGGLIALLIAAIVCVPHAVGADDDPQAVLVEGRAQRLSEALVVDPDGGAPWMHAKDLRALLGISWIEIPEAPPKTRGRLTKSKAEQVVLADLYAAHVLKQGVRIDEQHVQLDQLRALGWATSRAGSGPLTFTRRPASKGIDARFRAGHKAPAMRLRALGGDLAPAPWTRSKRHLVFFAATWHPSRSLVDPMQVFSEGLSNVAFATVFLDLGPATRVTDYTAQITDRWYDPLGYLIGAGVNPGSWAYIDEHGVVLAMSNRRDALMQDWLRALALRDIDDEPVPAHQPPPAGKRKKTRASQALIDKVIAAVDEQGRAPEALEEALAEATRQRPQDVRAVALVAGLAIAREDLTKATERLRETIHHHTKRDGMIRQYLALEDPGRFYDGPIDEKWVRQRRRDLRQR